VGIKYWTTSEVGLLREQYESLGPDICAQLLPGRSSDSVRYKARTLGLANPPGTFMKRKHKNSPHIDTQIRMTYQAAPVKGAISRLAERVGRPRWWVSRRARELGLVSPRLMEPDWADAEVELLARYAYASSRVILRKLKLAGFDRTETAITVKRVRLGFRPADNGYYTARQCAGLMGVDNKSVTRWIDKGLLKAEKRGTNRTAQQGGDHWWIKDKNIRRLIVEHTAAIDIRKVDKFWFVDLLTA
jgi:hypothetical protein